MLDGGAVTALTSTGIDTMACLTANTTDVFWNNANTNEIEHAPLAGGGAAVLFDGLTEIGTGCVRADDAHLLVIQQHSDLVQVILSNQSIVTVPDQNPTPSLSLAGDVAYFIDGVGIYRVTPGTTTRSLVASVQSDAGVSIAAVAGDDRGVYWVVNGPGETASLVGCADPGCSGGPQTLATTPALPTHTTAMIVSPDSIFMNGNLTSGPALIRVAR